MLVIPYIKDGGENLIFGGQNSIILQLLSRRKYAGQRQKKKYKIECGSNTCNIFI